MPRLPTPRSAARAALLLSLCLPVPAQAWDRAGAGPDGPPPDRLRVRAVRRLPPPPRGDLIQGYLPRLTEKPMYNEPPSRFPTY